MSHTSTASSVAGAGLRRRAVQLAVVFVVAAAVGVAVLGLRPVVDMVSLLAVVAHLVGV